MEQTARAPRTLPYRFYYKWYAIAFAAVWLLCFVTSALLITRYGWGFTGEGREELLSFCAMLFFIPALYLWWLHPKLTQKVQVYPDHVRISNKDISWEIAFNDIEHIERPFHSFMRLRMRDGNSWWFSAALERPDYLWEGLMRSRPELMGGQESYEKFRLSLVQFDHHEKRKEWFFRHRLLDVVNWFALPAAVLAFGFWSQSSDVVIYSKGLYFFRLLMYSLFTTISCAFIWSVVMKRFVFDRLVEKKMQSDGSKLRDLAYEDQVLQKAKFFQLATCVVLLTAVVQTDLNLFSVTKLKDGAQAFQMAPGKTVVIDNRFNCVDCKHPLAEGDMILFGRGTLGQVLALPGEVIAQTRETQLGRSIASETVTEVPAGHIALKTGANGQEVVLVPIDDLVGKLKKQ